MTSKLRSLIEKFRGNYYYHGEEIDVNKAKEILRVARDRIADSLKERELLEIMAHTISGCVWIKAYDYISESHTYEFANLTLCKSFFCFADSCLLNCTEHVKGKSDVELINEFMERFRETHTFAEMCEITDDHAVDQAIRYYHTNGKQGAKNCRYLESGFIGDRAVLFDVTKTPLFEKGQKPCWNTHTYLVGTATETTICCDSVYQMVLLFSHIFLSRKGKEGSRNKRKYSNTFVVQGLEYIFLVFGWSIGFMACCFSVFNHILFMGENMFNFLKMAFSATNGTPSSTRILTGLVILNVMGVWTYSCVNTNNFIPLGLDNIGLILSCLGAKVLQKKVEENCNVQN